MVESRALKPVRSGSIREATVYKVSVACRGANYSHHPLLLMKFTLLAIVAVLAVGSYAEDPELGEGETCEC
jgi:hypothetical protein